MLSPKNARRGRSPTTALRPFCLSILAAAVTFSLAATPAFAQLEGPAVSTGYDYGTQVAYNPATHFAYVSNWDDDGATSITQIDTITGVGTTIALCSGASAPLGIAVNPVTNMVYTANFGAGAGTSVSVFTGATDVNGTITNAACEANITGLAAAPDIVAVNPVTNVIYAASYSAGAVTAINGANNTVINTVTGLTASSIRAVAINPVTNYIYVAYGTTAPRIATYTGATNTGTSMALHATITSNQDYPSQLAVNPITNEVYVANCYYVCSDAAGGPLTTVSYFAGNATSGTASTSTTKGGEEVYNVAVNPATNTVFWGDWDLKAFDSVPGAPNGGAVGIEADATATSYQWEIAEDSTHNFEIYSGGKTATDWYTVNPGDAAIGTAAAQGAYPVSLGLDPITSRVLMADWNATNATPGFANTYTLSAAVATGTTPAAVAINPASGNVYVANSGAASVSAYSNSLTALTGSPISVGTTPVSVAVDPVTSTVYVANKGSNNITVIDETSTDANAAATVTVGSAPVAIAVNPVSNKVYVANNTGNSVSVYNENTGTVAATILLSPATTPYAIAIDPSNNTIYVADANGYVSQISGSANTLTASIVTGSQTGATNQQAIAVNPVTHNVYVANYNAASVTPITGCPSACAAGTALTAGTNPSALTVNPTTGDVYVADSGNAAFTVIANGASLGTFTGLCTTPSGVAMNTFSNLAFMTCSGTATSAINAWDATGLHAASASRYLASPTGAPVAGGIAVNNATQTAYVITASNFIYAYSLTYAQNGTLIADFPTSVAGATSDPDYVANDALYATTNTSPTFTVSAATSGYASQAQNIPVTAVYYAIDNPAGIWTPVTTAATGGGTNSATFTVKPSGVSAGVHTLYALATYGDEGGATTNGLFNDVFESSLLYQGTGTNPNIGPITSYPFVILSGTADTTTSLTPSSNPVAVNNSVTYTATVTPGTIPTGDTVAFYDGVTLLGTATVVAGTGNVAASYTTSYAATGTHYVTAVFSGDSNYTWSQSAILTETVNAGTAPTDSLAAVTTPYATLASITATSNASGSVATFAVSPSTLGAFSPTTCTIGSATATTCTSTFTPSASATVAGSPYANALSASFAGIGDFTPGSATSTLTISTQSPLILSVGSYSVSYGTPSQAFSGSLTYTGSGNPPTGTVTVTVYSGANILGTVSGALGTCAANACPYTTAAFNTSMLSAAASPYTVTPSFSDADGNYKSTPTTINRGILTITPAATTLSLTAATPGSASSGVTTTTLTATASPAVPNGTQVTFTDSTTGATAMAATTSSVASITVTTSTPEVSAGLNNVKASLAATANTTAATSGSLNIYLQGILFSFIGTHNFSGLLTGAADPYTCCAAGVEGTMEGTTAAAYGVSVYNFTAASQALPVTLTNAASGAFSLSNQCGTTLSAGEVCTLVFGYAPPGGDGCTPVAYPTTPTGNDCTYDSLNYPQGSYESATWSYTLPAGVLGGLGNQGFTVSGVAAASGTLAGKALLTPVTPLWLSVSPATVNFGAVVQGATSQTLTVIAQNTNNSSVPFTYTAPGSGNFTANNTCNSPLAANASCNIYLTMVTTNSGAFTDSLSLTPSGGAASTVNISGTVAAASTGMTLSSNNHNFGNVTDGATVVFSATLTNHTASAATLSFSNAAGTGYTTSTNCTGSLAAGATCTYGFTFAPTQTGASTDTLTITSDMPILPGSGGDIGTVTVSGTGVAGGHLTATSVTHNWGNISVGTSGGNYGVEITNSTSSAVTLTFSGLTNTSAGFTLVGENCPASLAANSSCELVFSFTPTATGFVTGTYPITSSSPLYFSGAQVSPSQITLEGAGQ